MDFAGEKTKIEHVLPSNLNENGGNSMVYFYLYG